MLLAPKDPDSPGGRAALLKAGAITGCDWDGDGDHDLIAGTTGGRVFLLTNAGTRTEPRFEVRLLIDPRTVGTPFRTTGPCAADWDGDGDYDLLVGTESSGVLLFRNVGTRTAPRLAEPVVLRPGGKPFTRGGRLKPHVTDWNRDGRPDLLVGTEERAPHGRRSHGYVWLSLRAAPGAKKKRRVR